MSKGNVNSPTNPNDSGENVIFIDGMYHDYFLDYASYVILERAVPSALDGLKPVQRRILHAMKEMDDGRYHKVANIIGQTMQFHPHGDASIGDALVNMGQKDLLIDCQGNWGDVRTGDSAAAARYIEARLTKFALEVAFNADTTEWQLSYDGRKKEPVNLPMKFPLLLAQGGEGIAVGLSTKILPHNFQELIQASVLYLKNKPFELYPDFQTGGSVDVAAYQDGHRGGKVRVRAKVEKTDSKTITIRELPFGVTTESLIESIIKAGEKGKIKIKKVIDNTAEHVEIVIELQAGTSPDVTVDALFAFTDCEVSISPNACVILNDKPLFLSVSDLLKLSTDNTKNLLQQELEIELAELRENWHSTSLEKIFIENRIYHQIEECESWEEVLTTIDTELRKYIITPSMQRSPNDTRLELMREITEDDLIKLTEIKIKKISKYNTFEVEEHLRDLEKRIDETLHHLANLIEFTIRYFENLLKKYGKGRERRTEIAVFDTIQAVEVVANNAKLYVNRAEGFVGMGMKKDEFVSDCSDIDDVIVFRKDGKAIITRISDKTFVGKDIIHVSVWRKGDDRTTYNMVYLDGKDGIAYVKRFQMTAITRDKEYDLTKGNPNSKVLYFTANTNGEAEIIIVQLSQGSKAKIKVFDYDFGGLDIKGRGSQGNILTKYPVKKILQKEAGKSTLGARQIWFEDVTGGLDTEGRGILLGNFDTGDTILVLYNDGSYEMTDYELSNRYESKNMLSISKFSEETVISAVHYNGEKGWTMVKRFKVETRNLGQKFSYLSEHKDSKLLFATIQRHSKVEYSIKVQNKKMQGELSLEEFVDIKGWKAMGNKLSDQKLSSIQQIASTEPEETIEETIEPTHEVAHVGDVIEFDVDNSIQVDLFGNPE